MGFNYTLLDGEMCRLTWEGDAQKVPEVIGDYNGEGFHTEQQHVGLYFLTSWY